MLTHNKYIKILLSSLIIVALLSSTCIPAWADNGSEAISISSRSYDVTKFNLPAGAKVLVVVEGYKLGGDKSTYNEQYVTDSSRWNRVRVTAYTRESDSAKWIPVVQSSGVMGYTGMSNHRYPGSGLTPIGVFKMHTPFGRMPALEGFSKDYTEIMISQKNQYWSDNTNTLAVNDDVSKQNGEKPWQDGYKTIYSYCIDSGFNIGNANKDGTALFLHCTKECKPSTAGCVAIDESAMIAIERLYALGDTYIAQAPESQFKGVYNAYNETGKSPEGTFTNSTASLPETETLISSKYTH